MTKEIITFLLFNVVVTLTLDSRSKQMFIKVRANNESWESHFMLSGVYGSVRA